MRAIGAEWVRQGKVELSAGLSAAEAVELGLADGIVDSLKVAVTQAGFDQIPKDLSDRPLVHLVERWGSAARVAHSPVVHRFHDPEYGSQCSGIEFAGVCVLVVLHAVLLDEVSLRDGRVVGGNAVRRWRDLFIAGGASDSRYWDFWHRRVGHGRRSDRFNESDFLSCRKMTTSYVK